MIKRSAEGVINDDDLVKSSCWECGRHDDNVLKCSKCSTARYCSKDCQRTSWLEGHKHKCKELKRLYLDVKENLRQVHKAMEGGVLEEGIQPNPKLDYPLVDRMYATMAYLPEGLFERFQGPSIETFYRSLNVIARGEPHWFFSGTVTNLEDATSSHMPSFWDEPNKKEFNSWGTAAFMISFDSSTASESDVDILKSFCSAEMEYETMTPASFLHIYCSRIPGRCDHETRAAKQIAKEARDISFREIFNLLRELFHKNNKYMD